jgi:hypothetical protein
MDIAPRLMSWIHVEPAKADAIVRRCCRRASIASTSCGMRFAKDSPSSHGSDQKVFSPLPTTQMIDALKKSSVTESAWQGSPVHDRVGSVRRSHNQ